MLKFRKLDTLKFLEFLQNYQIFIFFSEKTVISIFRSVEIKFSTSFLKTRVYNILKVFKILRASSSQVWYIYHNISASSRFRKKSISFRYNFIRFSDSPLSQACRLKKVVLEQVIFAMLLRLLKVFLFSYVTAAIKLWPNV